MIKTCSNLGSYPWDEFANTHSAVSESYFSVLTSECLSNYIELIYVGNISVKSPWQIHFL